MPNATPARDFLLPRLQALITDAAREGVSRDVAVAVLIDLVTGPLFNDAAPDPRDDVEPARDDAVVTQMDAEIMQLRVENREYGAVDDPLHGIGHDLAAGHG